MSKYHLCLKKQKQNEKQKKISQIKNRICMLSAFHARVLLLVGVFSLLCGYVFLSNTAVGNGFEISELNSRIASLKQNNTELERQILSLSELSKLEERVGGLDMVAVSEIDYLSIPGGVAMAR